MEMQETEPRSSGTDVVGTPIRLMLVTTKGKRLKSVRIPHVYARSRTFRCIKTHNNSTILMETYILSI
jgi:predicted NBD/HSP70 family sugar kinase